MSTFRLLTMLGVALALAAIITQIILPALRGTQLFPALRAEGYIRRRVASLKQARRERQLAEEALNPKAVMTVWAQQFGAFKGQLTPQVVMGGTAGGGNALSTTHSLIDLLSAKTAKDLAVDLSARPAPPPSAGAAK